MRAAPSRSRRPGLPRLRATGYDLSNLPFIPVPSVGSDPNSGTATLGILPVWLHTEDNQITRIIAPDLTHNPYFGWGVHGRCVRVPVGR